MYVAAHRKSFPAKHGRHENSLLQVRYKDRGDSMQTNTVEIDQGMHVHVCSMYACMLMDA